MSMAEFIELYENSLEHHEGRATLLLIHFPYDASEEFADKWLEEMTLHWHPDSIIKWKAHKCVAGIWFLTAEGREERFYMSKESRVLVHTAREQKDPDPEFSFQPKMVRRKERAIKHQFGEK